MHERPIRPHFTAEYRAVVFQRHNDHSLQLAMAIELCSIVSVPAENTLETTRQQCAF